MYSTISDKYAIICFENFQGSFEGIILVIQMHKNIFAPVTLPRGVVLSYFLPFFVYRYFFDVPLFLENHSVASHCYLRMLSVLLRGSPHYGSPFTASFPLLGAILRSFEAHFGGMISIPHFILLNFVQVFLLLL